MLHGPLHKLPKHLKILICYLWNENFIKIFMVTLLISALMNINSVITKRILGL